MTVTSGFFNSVNHDRLYDAEQISSIFDGIINDGVFSSVGEAFRVIANDTVNDSVLVGTGRAWFDHTWILNDARFSIVLDPPSLVTTRIDSIVIDVDRRDSVRKCSIIAIQGTGVSQGIPPLPTLVNEELHKQYRIANITMPPGNSGVISGSNIDYVVGEDDTPLVTGPLEVVNSSNFFDQVDAELDEFKNSAQEDFNIWFDSIKDFIEDLQIGNINLATSVDDITIEWLSDVKKLQVKNLGITRDKLSPDIQALLGILDTTGWGYNEYYSYVSTIPSSSEEDEFMSKYFTSGTASSWTGQQINDFCNILKSNTSKNLLWNEVNWSSLNLADFRMLTQTFGPDKYPSMIGKTIPLTLSGYGTFNFRVIGVNHDSLTSGGTALLTLQSTDIVTKFKLGIDPTTSLYSTGNLSESIEELYSSFDSSAQSVIKEVSKSQMQLNSTTASVSYNARIWIASFKELSFIYNNLGSAYDYYAGKQNDGSYYKHLYQGLATEWWVSDIFYSGYSRGQGYIGQTGSGQWNDGSTYHNNATTYSEASYGIIPCICA